MHTVDAQLGRFESMPRKGIRIGKLPGLCFAFFFFFPSTTFTVLLLSNSYHIHSPLLLGKVSEKKKKKSQDSQKPRMNEWGLTGKLSIATLIEVSCDANYSVAIDIR